MKRRYFFAAILLASTLIYAARGCRESTPPVPEPATHPDTWRTRRVPGQSRFNLRAPILPDPKLTPGDTLDVAPRDFCTPGYSKKVRDVPASVKRKVYELYGIRKRQPGEYEIDHLIPLQLGGSNAIGNLWPHSRYLPRWHARMKTAVGQEMHRRVCRGELDYEVAQREIAHNWIAAYKKYMKSESASELATSNEKVWVNLNSGKYFRRGDRHYGKTIRGKYMTEAQARRAGYDEAHRTDR